MASKMPFLPLFFGDLLASTALWGGEERALYMLLLAYQWTAGPIPKDVTKLARMAQYDLPKFKALWETVSEKFTVQGRWLVNARLEQHRVKSQQIAERNHNRAKTAADERWERERASRIQTDDASSNAPSIPPVDAIHSILSYPIPTKEKESEDQKGPSRNRKPELDRQIAVLARGRKIKEST